MTTYYAPWEDSPGKGSRDFLMQDASEWGSKNLTSYLGGSWGDPYGIFNPEQVSAWKGKASAPYNTGAGEGFDDSMFQPGRSETPFDFSGTPFTDFTNEQLAAYLAKLKGNAAGSKLGQGEVPFLPSLYNHNGQSMVSWGNQNSFDKGIGGFLDQMMPAIVGAAIGGFTAPWGGMSGVGGAEGALGAAGFEGMSMPGFGGGMGMSVPAAELGAVGAGTAAGAGAFGALGSAAAEGAGVGAGLGVGSEVGTFPGQAGVDMTGFSQPFSLDNAFNFASDIAGPNGFTTGYGGMGGGYVGDFTSSMMSGGSMSPFGAAGGGMIDLGSGGLGSVAGTGTPNSFLQQLMSRFGNMKDPLKLAASVAQQVVNKKNNKKMQDAITQSRQAGFPFQNYQYLAQMWADPAKRYEMLKASPAFQESQRYAQQAQARRNARTGDINSGFGAATIADTLGKNASAWDKQLFDQISKITGMDFNGNATSSQLAAQLYPQMGTNNMNTAGSIFDAVRSNQGFFPDMLKTFFG